MLDLKALEKDPEGFAKRLQRRGEIAGLSELVELIAKRKSVVQAAQIEQELLNAKSKALGKASKDEIEQCRTELRELSQRVKDKETELKDVELKLEQLAATIPNVPRDDVPMGTSDADNLEIKRIGAPRAFHFTPRDHVEIGQLTGTIDLQRAAKISGSRFVFLRRAASKLNRALIQYFLDFHSNHGDEELVPPYLVKAQAMYGTGQFPKFAEDVFHVPVPNADSLYLIPTAETSVTGFFADEILEEHQLPARFCAYSACFRSEAGSAGRDTRGIIRMHQFEKVEMVRFATPEQADDELERMVERASAILTSLDLPHRVMCLCTGDTGFSSEKTYDIEVWLPGQNTYREISSCSVFGSFQARRSNIRYRPLSEPGSNKKPKPEFLVTLNGSGLPLSRTIVAIMENHQQEDGSFTIPKVLRPYMGGMSKVDLCEEA